MSDWELVQGHGWIEREDIEQDIGIVVIILNSVHNNYNYYH